MNNKQKEIIERDFNIYDEYIERWTEGGVDMIIDIDKEKNIIENIQEYIDNFDIDEEIDLYRQSKDYREAFTIRESVKDFEEWIDYLNELLKELSVANNEDN